MAPRTGLLTTVNPFLPISDDFPGSEPRTYFLAGIARVLRPTRVRHNPVLKSSQSPEGYWAQVSPPQFFVSPPLLWLLVTGSVEVTFVTSFGVLVPRLDRAFSCLCSVSCSSILAFSFRSTSWRLGRCPVLPLRRGRLGKTGHHPVRLAGSQPV